MSGDSNGHGCASILDNCKIIHTERTLKRAPLFVAL